MPILQSLMDPHRVDHGHHKFLTFLENYGTYITFKTRRLIFPDQKPVNPSQKGLAILRYAGEISR